MGIPILGANTADDTYSISNSVRYNDGDSPQLSRTMSSGNQQIFTLSTWLKRNNISTGNQRIFSSDDEASADFRVRFNSADTLEFTDSYTGNSATYTEVYTKRQFRDSHAWYHIVVAVDTTQGTASNRVKIYVNGVQETELNNGAGGSVKYPAQNDNLGFGRNGKTLEVGASLYSSSPRQSVDMYLAETYAVDGAQLTPNYFGAFNDENVWIPVKPGEGAGGSITYGTNGFLLEYKQTGTSANSSGIGADTSGNDNHFTPTNLTATDITTDTPTNNFATMSMMYSDKQQGGAITFSEGGCQIVTSYVDANYQRYPQAYSSMAVSKGKWYFEMKPISGDVYNIGVFSPEDFASDSTTNPYGGYAATGVIYTEGGVVRQNDTQDTGHATYDDSDIVGCALDMDNNAVYFHKNNTYINSGNPTSGASKTGAFTLPTTGSNGTDITLYGFTCGDEGAADIGTMQINFGNPPYAPSSIETDGNGRGSFEYAPPSGYLALCTKNLGSNG